MNTKRDTTSATNSPSTHFRRRIGRAPLALLAPLALTLMVPVREANGQGTINFNNRIASAAVNQTGHIWGPSTNNPALALIGLGSNDNPSGTTPFGSGSGMALIGAGGSGGQYGYRTTFAQLIGAVGQNMPEAALVPLAGVTTFRTGSSLGCVAAITSTFTNNPASVDAPWATVEIVAWDNSSGLYPTWTEASVAWQQGLIAAGHSAAFNVANIGGTDNPPPYLTSAGQPINGLSFNLIPSAVVPGLPVVATLPASAVTADSVTLNGAVNPRGTPTGASFEWGTTTIYTNGTWDTNMGHEYITLPFSASLTGLTPGTTYHFRAKAFNGFGYAYGGDRSFTTGMPLLINTGSGYWNAASSSLSYQGGAGAGGGSPSFILLQSADPTAPLTAWTRVATNTSTPGSFPIPPVGTAAPKYYRVKSE